MLYLSFLGLRDNMMAMVRVSWRAASVMSDEGEVPQQVNWSAGVEQVEGTAGTDDRWSPGFVKRLADKIETRCSDGRPLVPPTKPRRLMAKPLPLDLSELKEALEEEDESSDSLSELSTDRSRADTSDDMSGVPVPPLANPRGTKLLRRPRPLSLITRTTSLDSYISPLSCPTTPVVTPTDSGTHHPLSSTPVTPDPPCERSRRTAFTRTVSIDTGLSLCPFTSRLYLKVTHWVWR